MSKITKIGLPSGGTTGQVLKKKTGTNYDVEWGTGGGGGSVTSVATTAPITGGTITTTGTIGITQATTSTDGYLSSTDWNTFNNKQSSLTNPVTGTGTTNYLPKFTGSSTIGNSTIQDLTTGVLVSPSVTASSGVAIGTSMTPSLTASANNNTLIGLKVTPTFTTGAYTGVTSIGAILESSSHRLEFYSTSINLGILQIKRGLFGSGTGDNGSYRLAFTNAGSIYIDASPATGEIKTVAPNTFFYTWTLNTEQMRLSTAGNLLIGTTTDSGFKLDVNGTARIQNDLTISDTRNIILSTTTGTKIGTATTQKIGFFNATPVVQPSAVTTAQGIADALSSLGLLASSTVASSGGIELGSGFDGMGSVVLVNSICYMRVKAAFTITAWSIVAEGTSPTCTIDILKIASGTTLPTASICASALPALSTGNAIKSTIMTGWTTSLTADDILAFKVTACSNATKITIQLYS